MSTETNEKEHGHTGRCCRSNRNHWVLTVLFCIIFSFLGFFAGKMGDCGKSTRCNSSQYSQGHCGGSRKGKCDKQKRACTKKVEKEVAIEAE